MILRLGTGGGAFNHRINSAGLAIEMSTLNDDRGIPYASRITWTVEFRLINTTIDPKTLDAEIVAIEAAYAQQWPQVSLRHDDGTATAHVINTGLIGPVRTTKPPSYARWQNGEYVSYRTGNVVLEALVAIGDPVGRITEYTERAEFSGGGAEFAFLQPNVGLPVKQQTRTNTPFQATQSGRITRLDGYPPVPAPIWPTALVAAPKVSYEQAKKSGAIFYDFPLTYSYQFASATALTL